MTATGIAEPVTLVGHSFGGSAWSSTNGIARAMKQRPLWDWGLHLQADLLPLRQLTRVVPVILDAAPNLLRSSA